MQPQAGERQPQILILDLWQGFGDARRRDRVGLGGVRLLAAPEWSLAQRNSTDGLPTEEAIDPLKNDGGQMLDFECYRAFNPQDQRGGFRRFFVHRARPADFERLAVSGNLRAYDIGPARNDFG